MTPEGHRTGPILGPTEGAGVLYSPVHVPLIEALGNQQGAEFVRAVTDPPQGRGRMEKDGHWVLSDTWERSGLLLRPVRWCPLLRDTQAST